MKQSKYYVVRDNEGWISESIRGSLEDCERQAIDLMGFDEFKNVAYMAILEIDLYKGTIKDVKRIEKRY